MKRLALIVAIAENGVIGREGQLPWDWPEDRAHFFRATRGHAVIMGRRTYEERGEPLPERRNIVVSRTMQPPTGVLVVPTLDEAIERAWDTDDEPFVIGGRVLFLEAMPRVTRALVTYLPIAPDGDARFAFDPTGFRVASERTDAQGARYVEYVREG